VRQLHIVGFTSDHDGLILAGRRGAKTGNFVIKVDDHLIEQIDEARQAKLDAEPISPALPPPPPRSRIESALSPREMQTRLRAGRTVAQVAAEAGVDIEWVERFAAPVLAEQAAAIARAQELVVRTSRRGQSDRGLASSVRRNLADRGILLLEEEFDSAWSAHQLADNDWIIRFRYRSRGRDQQAEYLLDTAAGTLTPNNRLGTELGYVDPGRHAPPVRELPPMRVRRSQRGRRRAREATSAHPALPARKPATKRAVAKKVATAKRSAPAKKASPGRKAIRTRARTTNRSAPVAKKRAPAKKTTAPRKTAVLRKTTAPRKAAATKRAAAAKKSGTAKKSTAKRAPTKRAAASRKTSTGKRAAPRKSATAQRATPARRATPAKKATPAKRPAANKRASGSVTHVRMTANGPRVRPLRAHRVETSGARNGSTPGVRVRTSAIGLPAVQFRLGGPSAWGFPGPGA
jgi:hypothetical protein